GAERDSGGGQYIEVPMYETMVAFNIIEQHRGQTFEPPIGPFGYERLMSPERRPYQSADGWLCMLPYTDQNWADFFAFIGQPELIDDERFATHPQRNINTDTLYGMLRQHAPSQTNAAWLDFCDDKSIPAMPVLDLADVMDEPHLQDVGLIEVQEHPTEGPYRVVHDAVVYSDTPTAIHRHSPKLGQHTQEILAEVGLDQAEIEAALASGAAITETPT
ncbi:MAG: crotonobetainyl-CoA:carnitine CoA-transferase CaiB-like acyl-CoA transferase, partial [Acidimicrobiales bacterium]